MRREMQLDDVRAHLDDVIRETNEINAATVIMQNGKRCAVLLSPERYDRYVEAVREIGWQAVQRVWAANADADPEEVEALVAAEVEAVRQEMYDQRQRASANGD